MLTKSGLVNEGDRVRMGSDIVTVLAIEEDMILFSGNVSVPRNGRSIWNLERVYD